MIRLQINNVLAKQMKEMGFFGDYILAKRLQSSYLCSKYAEIPSDNPSHIGRLIDRTLRWVDTPQGGKFWMNIYGKFTD